jgi:hypothetical protein
LPWFSFFEKLFLTAGNISNRLSVCQAEIPRRGNASVIGGDRSADILSAGKDACATPPVTDALRAVKRARLESLVIPSAEIVARLCEPEQTLLMCETIVIFI